MITTLHDLRPGMRFVVADGGADGHEGEPETLLVTGPPEINGFACRVPVKSETDGFQFIHAGNPADVVPLAPQISA